MFIELSYFQFFTINFFAVFRDSQFIFTWLEFTFKAFVAIRVHFTELYFSVAEFNLCIFIHIFWKHFQHPTIFWWAIIEEALIFNFKQPYRYGLHWHFRVCFYNLRGYLIIKRFDFKATIFLLERIWLIIIFQRLHVQFKHWNFLVMFLLFSSFYLPYPLGFSCTLKFDHLMLFKRLIFLIEALQVYLEECCSKLMFIWVYLTLIKVFFDCWNLYKGCYQPICWVCR